MTPLPFAWPWWLPFWSIFVWAFWPEFLILQKSRRPATGADSPDAGSRPSLHWGTNCSYPHPRKQKMPLLNLVVILIVVGVALHLINRYIPMASSIKTILNIA